jgi:hypothetical protein
MRKAQCLAILVAFILSRESIYAQEFRTFGANAYRELLRAAFSQLERFGGLLSNTKIRFLADGGGDGGDGGSSGDGSGSSGDGSAAGAAGAAAGASGDGTGSAGNGNGGDSSSDGDGASSSDGDGDSASASDAASAAASAATDAAASDAADAATTSTTTTTTDNDDEDNAPSNNNNNNNAQDPDPDPPSNPDNNNATISNETDPTTPTITAELATIEDQATTDPRGGSTPDIPDGVGIAPGAIVTTIPPGGFPPPGAPPENIEIHAVIVSEAQSPWDAIKRATGVGTITVVGGIVAMGKTPISGEIPGGGPQPDWLRLVPDVRLLNGSMIPPVVPNIMDIRWLNCAIKVEDPSNPVEEPNL